MPRKVVVAYTYYGITIPIVFFLRSTLHAVPDLIHSGEIPIVWSTENQSNDREYIKAR